MPEFNLVDERWILMLRPDGKTESVSLRDAFARGAEFRAMANELPTTDLAIKRMLLAICHDAVGVDRRADLTRLRREGLHLARIDAYLDEWHDRFWLFHESQPFMQVHDLRTAKGDVAGLEKLIADVPNGQPMFTTRLGAGLASITCAEAARWLVHAQAFDPAGIRSAAVGDAKTKGGKGYPIGPAWVGQVGGLVVHGQTLAETLVFNLCVIPRTSADRPVWALPPQSEQRSEDGLVPGPIALLTWQSRRVRLVGSSEGVTGLVLAQGDKMTPQNRQNVEYMSNWRYSTPQSKKFGAPTYMPSKHDADRSLWRSLPAALAPETLTTVTKTEAPAFIRAGVLQSLADHDRFAVLRVQAVGITYGSNEAVIDEIVSDSLDLRASLLASGSGELRAMLQDAVSATEAATRSLGNLASNVIQAAGERGEGAGDGERSRAMQRAWAALDGPARRWIAGLDDQTDAEQAHAEWTTSARRILQRLAWEIYEASPPAATAGRTIRMGAASMHMTSDVALSMFSRALTKALPLPSEDQDNKEER